VVTFIVKHVSRIANISLKCLGVLTRMCKTDEHVVKDTCGRHF